MGNRPISAYGIVGNDDRIALIGDDGSIDWCCFPHVDSPSVFGALLDAEDGGHFSVTPTSPYRSSQRYVERTNVLETRFETARGTLQITDFMPRIPGGGDPGRQQTLIRHVYCESGNVRPEIDFKPRFDYAREETSIAIEGEYVVARGDESWMSLQTHGPVDLQVHDGRGVGWPTLAEGEACWLVATYGADPSLSVEECRNHRDETIRYWREWSEDLEARAQEIAEQESWRDIIVRSGLVLKLLINEETGAIYAAATTSLPEEFGGTANWDYRYNWIRDAKFTVQALFDLGKTEEARDYFEWFRELSHDDPADIQPVYGVHGEEDLEERCLDHLAGYRFSTPVRVGNAAAEQLQLDIYGAIVQGIYETIQHDERLSEEQWASLCTIVDHVSDVWDRRGAGIWEYRSEPRHYVHSKLMCWVALDRGIELAQRHESDLDTTTWEREREAIRDAIESRGFSESADTFVQHFETEETIDATALLIPILGFLPPDDPRVEATIETVMDELLLDGGLVRRVVGPDARSEGPGAFLFCSFWLIDALVLAGRETEALELFENVLEHVEPPYLLPERIDPTTGVAYGNFPQAFSHIGLINSVIYLAGRHQEVEDHDPVLFRN